jgi:hypothetical protein
VEAELPNAESNTRAGRLGAMIAVAAVGLIIGVAGAASIFTFWSSHEQRETGIVRAAIFSVVMAAVSAAGYLLYINQSNPKETLSQVIGWAAYRPALRTAIIVDCIFLTLGALMLDMGQALHICTVAAIAHWATILVIICGRPKTPTKIDLTIIRWGYIPIMLVVATIGPLIWAPLGRW